MCSNAITFGHDAAPHATHVPMSTRDAEITLAIDGAVARVVIARPAKRNALAARHWSALESAIAETLAARARVLVIEGQPGAFSAGADIDELSTLLGDTAAMSTNAAQTQRALDALHAAPLATIAAIDGICVGGGLGIALSCDLRIATRRTRFGLSPAKLGLVYSPADTARLIDAVGVSAARELLLGARLVESDEAERVGLVHQLVANDGLTDAVAARAGGFAALSPQSIAGTKAIVRALAERGDAAAARERAQAIFESAFASADFAEGARAFVAKREPRFQ